jgi:hypothetical protein
VVSGGMALQILARLNSGCELTCTSWHCGTSDRMQASFGVSASRAPAAQMDITALCVHAGLLPYMHLSV